MSRRHPATMQEFAQFLTGLFEPQRGPSRWELEAMLQKYGADRFDSSKRAGPGALDIAELTKAFCRLREQRGIPAGLYRAGGPTSGPGGPSRGVTNPLLPGQSATQTRAGIGQVGTQRAPPYNGYSMPGEASSSSARPAGAFQSLMTAAYLSDVLVGDHFEKYGRVPHG